MMQILETDRERRYAASLGKSCLYLRWDLRTLTGSAILFMPLLGLATHRDGLEEKLHSVILDDYHTLSRAKQPFQPS